MIADVIFYVGLSILLTHELDAVRRHEWRIFPVLSRLSDDLAYRIFTIAHVPLLVLLLWLLCHPSSSVRYWFQVGIDLFLMLHLGLHVFFESHEENEFKNTFSRGIIVLGAVAGGAHLLAVIVG